MGALRKFISSVVKFWLFMALFYGFILVCSRIFRDLNKEQAHVDSKLNKREISALLFSGSELPSTTDSVHHDRCWISLNKKQERCLQYSMSTITAKRENLYKSNELLQRVRSRPENYWQTIYGMLYRHNPGALSALRDSLMGIANNMSLNRQETVKMIVSFVQDMPYTYILEKNECKGKYSEFPCLTGITFGLLSPQEMAYTAFGDCDSKALLLYSLLRTIGYRPLIVTSNEYAHAMLAMNIPTSGDFVTYKGERFYFWETTATGWQPGMLPPNVANKDYWKIELDYEY